MTITKAEVAAGLNALRALADAVRELREVPAGNLYVAVMGVMSVDNFNKAIGLLVDSKVIRRDGDLLKWNVS